MNTPTETDAEKRQSVINAHRHVASLLEEHDDLPMPVVLPYGGVIHWSLYSWDCPDGVPAMVARIRRIVGGRWDKSESNDYGTEKMVFTHEGYRIEVNRETVCTRRVVGTTSVVKPAISLPERTEVTEIVEWDCAPVLAGESA